MDLGDDAEQEEAMLRVRALKLRELAKEARVMAGTLAARDLERVRAEVEEVVQAIDRAEAPFWAIADWLKGIAVTLESALYMGGINASDAPPVGELQQRLAAWFEGAGNA